MYFNNLFIPFEVRIILSWILNKFGDKTILNIQWRNSFFFIIFFKTLFRAHIINNIFTLIYLPWEL